ncbi:MAG TPA: DNA repair protein RadC [Opitutaceae bacterium]|nr:DNA repair protein RadC [Opitutaceae bacterium]
MKSYVQHELFHTSGTVCSEQPQARLDNFGAGALSDTELIALVLHCGIAGRDLRDLAGRLLAEAGSLRGFLSWQPVDFQRLRGIGWGKARQLAAMVEIARRIARTDDGEAPLLNRPELVAQFMAPYVTGLEIEKFWVACVNRKNRLKKLVEVTSGTATSSLAHPREVFRCAIQHGATGIVCIHNHPSGDPAPSAADVQVTRQLREASRAVDIELLDHVIVGRAGADPRGVGYHSFRECGVL